MTDLELRRYMTQGINEEEAKGIEKMIYLTYPRTKKEKECKTEKANRDELRELKRKREIMMFKEKREFEQK
jgi:hypothetical protein